MVDLSCDPHHYEIRHIGRLRRVDADGISAKNARWRERVCSAQQQLTWGPDESGVHWVPVSGPHPNRYDILVTVVKHHSSWRCVGVQLDSHHYAHCCKSSKNMNENRSWCLGYDARTDMLGPGLAGSPAENRIVCLLTLVKKCNKGRWHLPAQYKLRNERGRTDQTDATCMKSLFDLTSEHLKCKVRGNPAACAAGRTS